MANNLTPTLTLSQLKENIDALGKGGMASSDIQTYVNNYARGSDGNYALKSPRSPSGQPAQPSPQGGEPSGGFAMFGGGSPVGGNADSTQATTANAGLAPLEAAANAVTHSEQAAGQDISSAIGENIPAVKKAQAGANASNQQLASVFGRVLQERHRLAAAGKDTSQLDSILTDDAKTLGITNLQEILPPGAQKTALQTAADFAGVALDVISAGSYGPAAEGAETGELLIKGAKTAGAGAVATGGIDEFAADRAAEGGEQAATQAPKAATVGQNLARVGVKTAKTAAEGAAMGYGYDVTNAAQQGKTGVSMFKPGVGTAIGAGIPLLAGGMTAAGQASKGLGHMFSGSYLPDVADEFAEQGIRPPVGAVTTSGAVQGAEALASKGMFGKDIVASYANAASALDAKTDSIVASIRPMTNLSDENLGKSIQDGLKEYDDNFRVTEDKVYAEFGDQYGSSPTIAATTKDTLSSIMQEQGSDYYKGVDPSLKRMLDRMSGLSSPEAKQLLSQGYSAEMIMDQGLVKEPELTFNELKATRTSIGEQLSRRSRQHRPQAPLWLVVAGHADGGRRKGQRRSIGIGEAERRLCGRQGQDREPHRAVDKVKQSREHRPKPVQEEQRGHDKSGEGDSRSATFSGYSERFHR